MGLCLFVSASASEPPPETKSGEVPPQTKAAEVTSKASNPEAQGSLNKKSASSILVAFQLTCGMDYDRVTEINQNYFRKKDKSIDTGKVRKVRALLKEMLGRAKGDEKQILGARTHDSDENTQAAAKLVADALQNRVLQSLTERYDGIMSSLKENDLDRKEVIGKTSVSRSGDIFFTGMANRMDNLNTAENKVKKALVAKARASVHVAAPTQAAPTQVKLSTFFDSR